jgi:hypothetical protein
MRMEKQRAATRGVGVFWGLMLLLLACNVTALLLLYIEAKSHGCLTRKGGAFWSAFALGIPLIWFDRFLRSHTTIYLLESRRRVALDGGQGRQQLHLAAAQLFLWQEQTWKLSNPDRRVNRYRAARVHYPFEHMPGVLLSDLVPRVLIAPLARVRVWKGSKAWQPLNRENGGSTALVVS